MLQDLQKFLIESNRHGYAAGDAMPSKKERDGSTTINFSSGEWRVHDNFFGGEPYGGRMVVFYKDKPYWIMVYYGNVAPSVSNIGAVYTVLQHALKKMPEEAPFRGPKEYKEGDFVYKNNWKGELEAYSGEEVILLNNEAIYKATYMGGLVDQREE